MMKNKFMYKLIIGEEIDRFSAIDHKVTCYVDDVQHVVGHKSNIVLQQYINALHALNKGLYAANFLKMNASKTEFIHIRKTTERQEKITITDDEGVIESQPSMRILGFHTNERNNLETHISKLMKRIGKEYHYIRPAL